MHSAFVICALSACVALSACKNKDDGEPAAGTDEPAATAVERSTDSDSPGDAAPEESEAPELGEAAFVAFRADTGEAKPVNWEVSGALVALTVISEKSEKSGAPVIHAKISATLDDDEPQEVYACENLDPATGGYVDFMVRGDKVHIRCIHPAHAGKPGETQGARFALDADAGKLVQSGGYSGEGIVDPDTIDLDEE